MLSAEQMETINCPCCNDASKQFLFDVYDHEFQTTEQLFPLNKCNKCHLIYLSPRPNTKSLDIIYPLNYNNFHTKEANEKSYVRKISNSLQAKRLKKLINKYCNNKAPIKVLDVGCGDGLILDRIKEVFPHFKTYGIEPNKKAAEIAGESHEVYCGLMENFETDIKFDLITSSHVIEHVADPLNFLIKIKNMLSEKGIAIIDTPNVNCFQYKIFRKHWGGVHAPRHWTLFDNETFNEIGKRAGLTMVDIKKMSANSFWILSIHSFLYSCPKLRSFADRFFCYKTCVSKKSYYYLCMMIFAEFLEKVTGFFRLGLGLQRGVFVKAPKQ